MLALRRWLGATILAATLAVGLFSAACAAPTLPLPPPTALASSPDASGNVTVTGRVSPDALVFALDEDRGMGVIVTADAGGNYTAVLPASIGETITIWQMIGTRTGELTSRVVR